MWYCSKNGKYQLQIEPDGAIRVKHGDWLSKYSSAIYNNYWTINVFGRKNEAGNLIAIRKPNRIDSGDPFYHVPTFGESGGGVAFTPPEILSDFDKKKILLDSMKENFH